MRLLVHDFAGHPFAAELSRELARRGHSVAHAYCGGVTTGRGALTLESNDPSGLRFVNVSDDVFERYSPLARLRSEAFYGRRVARLVRQLQPDAVLSANSPLVPQALIWRAARRCGAKRVFWLQDFLGRGTRSVLDARSPMLGQTVGRAWEALEIRLLQHADHIVAIADDFRLELDRCGVSTSVSVIENWTPVDEVCPRPKETEWSSRAGLAHRPIALYAGTLGLKHDPEHLVAAAQAMQDEDGIVLVVSEGLGRSYLESRRRQESLNNLWLWNYVDYQHLPDLLGAADVCLVLLEREAGRFSVPSKVLTYLAAGRAIVGAIPTENLAARTLCRAGAGTLVSPGDHEAFGSAVATALRSPSRVAEQSRRARQHAESHFEIGGICDQFECALTVH